MRTSHLSNTEENNWQEKSFCTFLETAFSPLW